jgi:hypothetical protein
MHAALLAYIVTVNFALMGWAWFVFDKHQPALNSRFFDAFAFEKNGQLYGYTGLLWFREFQHLIGWNKLLGVPNIRLNKHAIEEMEWGTRFGEATHWLCLITLLPIAGWSAFRMSGIGLPYWLVSAIVLHVYPIMLQRYHRPRFRRLLKWMKMRDSPFHIHDEPNQRQTDSP